MKYNIGDKVQIKSIDWYNENKGNNGSVDINSKYHFGKLASNYCGIILTIKSIINDAYIMEEPSKLIYWTDEMIEKLVEKKTYNVIDFNINDIPFADKVEIQLGNKWEVKEENGKIYVVKKAKELPKTYKECCDVLGCKADHFFTDFSYKGCDVEISDYEEKVDDLLQIFRKLRYCRDAYWKIAGEEMGLGKSWEPDWKSLDKKYNIYNYRGVISHDYFTVIDRCILVFPTDEMRDAFYENFKYLIELVKELL